MKVNNNEKVEKYFMDHSKFYYISTSEFILISIVVYLRMILIMLRSVERLFINIYREDTPFTLINVKYIRRIAFYLILSIFGPAVFGTVF